MQDADSPLRNLLTDYPSLSALSSQIDALSEKKTALNPFAEVKSSAEIVEEMNKKKEVLSVTKDSVAVQEPEISDIQPKTENTGNEEIAEEIVPDEVSEEIQQGNFCLILGSFKDKRNAERFFEKKQKDFPNAKFFQSKGFYRITSDVFVKKSDAVKEKKYLKNQGVSSWVMKY